MHRSRFDFVHLWLATAFLSISGAAFGQALECETIDFNDYNHAESITNLTLFGGDLNLSVTALRNSPMATVDATAYDMEKYDLDPNTARPLPPNRSHWDTQRFILCNDAANGNLGTCDGIGMMVPDVDFIINADDSQGGFITLSGFGPQPYIITQYDAADSDANGLNIILRVGAGLTQIGTSMGQGDGSVENVITTGLPFIGDAQFEYEGSGAVDDIEICREIIIEPASLGDRVWEDIDRDGIQDCSDDNNNGIIGDAGDSGPECNTGIPNIPVELLAGDCATSLGQMTMTDADGFYGFDNLEPGDYCVQFGLPPDDFCTTDGFELGSPVFTSQNAGPDDSDSDADPDTGVSDPTNLSSGESDLTIDAGIYCPAKIGDFVWSDDNGNGIQDGGEDGVSGIKTTLFECGPDMVAGTADDVMTGEMRFTDVDGMYMYGAETNYELPPGKYYVQFDPSTLPPNTQFTIPGVGPDDVDSDCRPPNGNTTCTDLSNSRSINLDRDCGIVTEEPDCNLLLDKTCRVEAPPQLPLGECNGKLQQFTVIWAGAGPITAAGPNNTVMVNPGDEATFDGPFSDNDVMVLISGDNNGSSVFHVSCSDDDFNDPSDCGKLAGDGKGNDTRLINDWRLEGYIDDDGEVLDCTADTSDGGFAQNCNYEQQPLPTCDNGPKPDNLSWRYDGGTGGDGNCADSTFFTIVNEDGKLHEDFECSGSVNTSLQVTAVDDDGNVFLVNPGDTFTTRRDDSKTISLTDSNGNTQELVFHTSCSQPLEAQATAGALTLAALDNRDGAQDVTYRYEVTNLGDPLTNVGIVDDPLGTIASGLTLDTDASADFERSAEIFGTTVNTAQASGTLPSGGICAPASAFDSVTVAAVIPPCSLSVVLDEVKDDSLKIDITNNGNSTVTLNSLLVSFPSEREHVKELKLDGDFYKRNDSDNPVDGTPAFFGPDDWTNDDARKRQVEPDKTETLEIKTTEDGDRDGRFEVDLDFGDGCQIHIVVENQQLIL